MPRKPAVTKQKRGRGRPRKPRRVESYAQLGPPPNDDPLKLAEWTLKMLARAMHEIAIDPDVKERDRQAGIRSTAGVIAKLMPFERLRQAEQAAQRVADTLEGDASTEEVGLEDVDQEDQEGSTRISPDRGG